MGRRVRRWLNGFLAGVKGCFRSANNGDDDDDDSELLISSTGASKEVDKKKKKKNSNERGMKAKGPMTSVKVIRNDSE